jgi:hypothetical protein
MNPTIIIRGFENRHKLMCSRSGRYIAFWITRDLDEEWRSEDGHIIGLLRYDEHTSGYDDYEFRNPVHKTPIGFTGNALYYLTLGWNGPVARVSIFAVRYDAPRITEQEVYAFEISG